MAKINREIPPMGEENKRITPQKQLAIEKIAKQLKKTQVSTQAIQKKSTPQLGEQQIKKKCKDRRKSYPPMMADAKGVKVENSSTSSANRHRRASTSVIPTTSASQRKALFLDTSVLEHYQRGENPRKSSFPLRKNQDNKLGYTGRRRHRHSWQGTRQDDYFSYKDGTYNANPAEEYTFDSY